MAAAILWQMPGLQSTKSNSATLHPDRPETYGNSLAHVLRKAGGEVTIAGQAWLVAPGQLVTCGHVVENYLEIPDQIIVKFPASGHEYEARHIKLHPRFSRERQGQKVQNPDQQPDHQNDPKNDRKNQFIKYDAALILFDPIAPESTALNLPLSFEKNLAGRQTLWALRYPSHLGVLSQSPSPLMQEGQLLGRLQKNDKFHLLHDLALSPGDSGSALFDQFEVVAIHCGDTASLPGLNIPTTSIRLGLSIDALRELGISAPTASQVKAARSRHWPSWESITLFLICTFAALLAFRPSSSAGPKSETKRTCSP